MFQQNTKFPIESFDTLSLAQSTKEYLSKVGLPSGASPFLGFGDFDGIFLPRLSKWPLLEQTPLEELGNLIVIGSGYIGSGDSDNPICIVEETEEIIMLEQDKAFKKMPMNSSVFQLIATLNDYDWLVEQTIDNNGDLAYQEYNIPVRFTDDFEAELINREPKNLGKGSFWVTEIARLREELIKFEAMEKYDFDVRGFAVDEVMFEPKQITFTADAQILKELAKFFTECAEGIENEKDGEIWGHVHFSHVWKEWYSAYPDIVVNNPKYNR